MSWFKDRLARVAGELGITSDDVERLVDEARGRARQVVKATALEAATKALDVVDAAVELLPGQTFREFAQDVAAEVDASLAEPPRRVETDAHAVTFSGFNGGRVEEFRAVGAQLEFQAVIDGRTSAVCTACNGTRLPADDSWWRDHTPPLHPNCRSVVVPVEGAPTAAPAVDAGAFGRPEGWTPDLSHYPPDLRDAAE